MCLKRWFAAGAALAGSAFGFVGMAAPAHAASPYPVPYTFLTGPADEALHPGASPAGANNWSCKLSAAHPEPVVLVHGLFANQTDNWATIAPLLANAGYCVFALTYGTQPGSTYPQNQSGGVIPMEQSAQQLGAFIDKVLSATGATKVDLVGHSEGATMPDYYAELLNGASKIDHYVGIAGVLHGTTFYGASTLQALANAYGYGSSASTFMPWCQSCTEFVAGSAFIQKLDATGLAAPGVTYTMIATTGDELVQPYNSGFINSPQSTNITVQDQCPLDRSDHVAVVSDPTTSADVLNALDPAHPVPVPCQPVLPVIG